MSAEGCYMSTLLIKFKLMVCLRKVKLGEEFGSI